MLVLVARRYADPYYVKKRSEDGYLIPKKLRKVVKKNARLEAKKEADASETLGPHPDDDATQGSDAEGS